MKFGGASFVGVVVLASPPVIVLRAAGQGFWSRINLGVPAFVTMVAPPLSMLPSLRGATGISLPASAMSQMSSPFASGQISAAVANRFGSMQVPVARVTMIGELTTGHSTNHTVSPPSGSMTPAARDAVMLAVPASGDRVNVGRIQHVMMSAALGVALLRGNRRTPTRGPSMVGPRAGVLVASKMSGALVYVVMCSVVLSPTNSTMAFVSQWAFFIAHLMFGALVDVILFAVLSRCVDVRRASCVEHPVDWVATSLGVQNLS